MSPAATRAKARELRALARELRAESRNHRWVSVLRRRLKARREEASGDVSLV